MSWRYIASMDTLWKDVSPRHAQRSIEEMASPMCWTLDRTTSSQRRMTADNIGLLLLISMRNDWILNTTVWNKGQCYNGNYRQKMCGSYRCCTRSRHASILGLWVLVASRVWATFIGASFSSMHILIASMFFSMSKISWRTCTIQTLNKNLYHRDTAGVALSHWDAN